MAGNPTSDRAVASPPTAVLAGALIALPGAAPAQEQGDGEDLELDAVEVIGVTPQHGTGLPKDKVPSNVKSYSDEEMDRIQTLDFTEFMRRRGDGVHTNTLGGNPLQPEVSIRGFGGSALLGSPQGISVFQDGVRINETFGDIVNWDLVPRFAIANAETMSGSNPVFGLNTLGGAISLQTKSGFTHPQRRISAEGGAWGRYQVTGEAGAHTDETAFYIGGNRFEENGWRDFSDSEANTLFGKMSWRGNDTILDVSVNVADTELRGNGATPVQLLNRDREAVFTHPDITENDHQMVTVSGAHFFTDNITVDGNLFFRRTDTSTFNGDESDFEAEGNCDPTVAGDCELVDEATGDVVRAVQFGLIDDSNLDDERIEALEEGTANTSDTKQDTFGGTLQGTFTQDLLDMDNQLVVGATAAFGDTAFEQGTQLATLSGSRGAVASSLVVESARTEVDSSREDLGFYLTDTLSVTDRLAVTVSGRYNQSRVRLDDQLRTALNGTHTFERFNPAGGLTYRIHPLATAFASWSQSNRAPTPVELTCADPDDPCRLPNGFQADPPLDQPVAQTVEAGFRGQGSNFQYSLAFFRTEVQDDIYFINAGEDNPRNAGFFDNIGETRRVGVELGANGIFRGPGPLPGAFRWFASATYQEATFRDDFRVNSPSHPNASGPNGESIPVSAGDTLPQTPQWIVKGGADWQPTNRLSLGFDVVYNGEQYLRGDEGNFLDPMDSYAVLNLRGSYQFTDWFRMFARVDNVLDNDFETAGLLGETEEADEILDNQTIDNPRFLTPGPPLAGWVGVEFTF